MSSKEKPITPEAWANNKPIYVKRFTDADKGQVVDFLTQVLEEKFGYQTEIAKMKEQQLSELSKICEEKAIVEVELSELQKELEILKDELIKADKTIQSLKDDKPTAPPQPSITEFDVSNPEHAQLLQDQIQFVLEKFGNTYPSLVERELQAQLPKIEKIQNQVKELPAIHAYCIALGRLIDAKKSKTFTGRQEAHRQKQKLLEQQMTGLTVSSPVKSASDPNNNNTTPEKKVGYRN